jgi:hypothetical protein
MAMRLAVAMTILVVDEARRWHEELRLLEGLHLREVEVAPRAPESPRDRVVRARHQLRHVEGAKGEAKAADADFGVEGVIGAHANAAEARRPTVARRHPSEVCGRRSGAGEKKQRWSDA